MRRAVRYTQIRNRQQQCVFSVSGKREYESCFWLHCTGMLAASRELKNTFVLLSLSILLSYWGGSVMKYTQDGRLICNETDLAVLHRAAERGKAWGNLSVYASDVPAGLPPIPSAQAFVLLSLHPLSYGSYLSALQKVMKISNDSAEYYFTRTIDSELRKPRRIVTPFPYLMALQRWILRNILDRLEVSPVSFAYRKGVSLADNAAPHLGKRRLVKLDIRHFFESISSGKVYTVFEETGYAKPIATLLTKLCTLRGCLPQGAPTSPALANLVMRRFDAGMNTYCLEHGISYTRYSDDLTFSADEMDAGALIRFARSALREEGFALNFEKIRVLGAGAQHRVCGLVVNEKLSVRCGRNTICGICSAASSM